MPEEEKGSVLDAALESVAETIQNFLTPEEKHKPGFIQKWLSLHSWIDFAGTWYVSRGFLLSVLYVPFFIVAQQLFPQFLDLTFGWLLLGLPIIAPVGAYFGFQAAWLWYAQSYYIFTRTNPVLLEIKMPADITKSPRAMEQVLSSFWIRAGTTTFIDRGYYGGSLPYTSLEICSFGGEIHFFIWCRSAYRNMIESAMYSQYPEVEIVEAEDYASKFQYDPSKHHCFVTDYIYDPPDRKDYYPMKTYVNFELDKDPKEEHKVEPYASVLEVLSAMNKDEQGWIQIVIRGYFSQSWQKEVLKEVEKIRDSASQGISLLTGESEVDVKKLGFPRPTLIQREQMENMERNLSKLIFEVGLRGIYIAPAGKMRSAEYTAFRWIWRPFNNPNYMTQLRPRRAHNDFDYLWQDWGKGPDGVRWQLTTRRYFDAYRRRQFWSPPWIWPEFHMSTEVLATLWHPPSRTVAPPGLQRVSVSKSQAPSNLPM